MDLFKENDEHKLVNAKKKQAYVDLVRLYADVFRTDQGKKVLEHLDKIAHEDYPNFQNVNFNYAKGGQQKLVSYIRGMLLKEKKIGG